MTRALAVVLAAMALLAACGTSEPYFAEPDRTGVDLPGRPGDIRYIGIAFLQARAGDVVKMVRAEPLGASAELSQLRWHVMQLPSPEEGASIGVTDAADPAIRALLPMEGATVLAAGVGDSNAQTEVVVEIGSDEARDVRFDGVRLHFTVNGQPRTQDFPMAVAVCFAPAPPERCEAGADRDARREPPAHG